MAKIVNKLFGTNPETIHVLQEAVTFDITGCAEVSEEVAAVFEACPGYKVSDIEDNTDTEEADETSTEETEEVEEVETAKPKRLKKAVPAKK